MDVESFCNLLIRGRVLPRDRVKSLYARWREMNRHSWEVDEFVDWLTQSKHLTRWQGRILRNGDLERLAFGPYRLIDRVGKGDVAGTYTAFDLDGRIVAVKILPASKAEDTQMLNRFQREGKLAMQLNHPNIVRTYDVGEVRNLHYLAMDYLDGVTLHDLLLFRKRISPLETARIGFFTALGLQHIHEQGLIHRDLNPKNIMLCPRPNREGITLACNVKILDVGLGRRSFDPSGMEVTEGLTNDEDILGSRDYLSPEQARDARRVDIRSDIYGLGCILYQALAGAPPFQDDNPIRQILRHANEEPRPLVDIVEGLCPKLNDAILKMLAKEPENRQSDPQQVADELKAVLAELTPEVP